MRVLLNGRGKLIFISRSRADNMIFSIYTLVNFVSREYDVFTAESFMMQHTLRDDLWLFQSEEICERFYCEW